MKIKVMCTSGIMYEIDDRCDECNDITLYPDEQCPECNRVSDWIYFVNGISSRHGDRRCGYKVMHGSGVCYVTSLNKNTCNKVWIPHLGFVYSPCNMLIKVIWVKIIDM